MAISLRDGLPARVVIHTCDRSGRGRSLTRSDHLGSGGALPLAGSRLVNLLEHRD